MGKECDFRVSTQHVILSGIGREWRVGCTVRVRGQDRRRVWRASEDRGSTPQSISLSSSLLFLRLRCELSSIDSPSWHTFSVQQRLVEPLADLEGSLAECGISSQLSSLLWRNSNGASLAILEKHPREAYKSGRMRPHRMRPIGSIPVAQLILSASPKICASNSHSK